MADASILVVEDNPMSRATAVDMFIDLGFAVFDAYNGYHALALLERHPRDQPAFCGCPDAWHERPRTRRVSAATTAQYQDRSHLGLR